MDEIQVVCAECNKIIPHSTAAKVWKTIGKTEECTYRCEDCTKKIA
jgi:hypothetical protein